MQLLPLFILSLGAVTSASDAASGVSCWKSGPAVSAANIAPSIVTICNYLQSPGYLPGEERYQCVQDRAGVKWDFALTFIGKGQSSRPITSGECQDGMNKQIQCTYGGETSYGNWKYRQAIITSGVKEGELTMKQGRPK